MTLDAALVTILGPVLAYGLGFVLGVAHRQELNTRHRETGVAQ